MTSSSTPKFFRLLDLPFELRTLILSSIDQPRERAAIARTCKLLRDEIEDTLYSDIVLRDSIDADALFASLEAKPARVLKIKAFTTLYPFGLIELQRETSPPEDASSDPRSLRLARSARYDIKQERLSRAALLLLDMKNLESLSVRTQDLRPYVQPDLGADMKAATTFRSLLDQLSNYGGHIFNRVLFPSLTSFELDPGYVNDQNDRWDSVHGAIAFALFNTESITLRRFDACEASNFFAFESDEDSGRRSHGEGLIQKSLTLEDCEINSIGLEVLLERLKRLTSLKLTNMDSIWDGWNEDGTERGDLKGRWIDILQAVQKADLQDQLQVLELTSLSRHCTIPDLELPLDFTTYTSLQDLTLDAHSSIKGLPDTLRSLTLVRPNDFPGACLPLLEDRLREVRCCALPKDIQRKVTIKIPDRSRGYESLRVMADTWKALGFEPVIKVHS